MDENAIHELTAGYALNALDPAEAAEFEDHLAGCRQCREELASLQAATSSLAYGVEGPAPPAALRSRILAQARNERANVVPLHRRRPFQLTAGLAAAAAAAALVLAVWASSLSNTLSEERQARQNLERATAILAQQGTERIPVSGAQGTLVVAPTGEAALVVAGLDPAPDDKTYEAWVIEGGTPKPAGLFDADEGRTVVALERRVASGAVVAVTLEREGGVDEPTTAPLLTAEHA